MQSSFRCRPIFDSRPIRNLYRCPEYGYTDYPVGSYILFSCAKKTARNEARKANAWPTSFADIFFVYDDTGECRYRVTFDDLPFHLRHPPSGLETPESLPPRPSYNHLLIKVASLLHRMYP